MPKKKPKKKSTRSSRRATERNTAKRPTPLHSTMPASRQQRLVEKTWQLPLFSGSRDRDAAWAYLQRFMVFESWIVNERRGDFDESAIPPEHEYLLTRWPEAFEMFRHAMWSYAERVMGINPWTSTLRSLLARSRHADPAGYTQLATAVASALPTFTVQRNNVLQQIQDEPSQSTLERHRAMVKLYADMYEVDFPLWLIGVLGRAYRTGKIDPAAFGGPATSLPQGSLIDAVRTAVSDTPLAPLLDAAYIPGLRNCIGHNSYAVIFGDREGSGFAGVRDAKSNEIWDAPTVVDAWQNTSDLMNAAMSACASTENVVVPSHQKQYADCGVIAINYAVNNGIPLAVVAQLWCFRDVDPDGSWLDSAEFIIEDDGPDRERAGFTPRAFMSGTPLSPALVGQAVRDRGWIRVIRVPVAPFLDMGFPLFEHVRDGKYEVVGIPDEHDVPLRRSSTLPRARTLLDAFERDGH